MRDGHPTPVDKSGHATCKLQSSANTSLACLLPCQKVGAPAVGSVCMCWGGGGLVRADKVIGIHGLMSPHALPCWSRLGGETIICSSWASLPGDLQGARQGAAGSGDKGK